MANPIYFEVYGVYVCQRANYYSKHFCVCCGKVPDSVHVFERVNARTFGLETFFACSRTCSDVIFEFNNVCVDINTLIEELCTT